MKEQLVDQEALMRFAFQAQASAVLQNQKRFIKPPGLLRVGLEMEAGLCKRETGAQLEEIERNRIMEGFSFADVELGASQIEWRTEPIVLNTPGGLEALCTQAKERDTMMRQSAMSHGSELVRLGVNPFIPLTEVVRTNKTKYQLVPDFHNRHRMRRDTFIGEKEQIDVGDAAVVALLNSLQCNMEAQNFEDAIDLTNRSLMIGPLVVALSGNARILGRADTGLADLRMIAWERSHDTRNPDEIATGKPLRVGLPAEYFSGMEDYFERISRNPFILSNPDHALSIGIGLFWQDTRIKVINDSLVVEFRPVSIQPTVEEDIATMLFYLGRLEWSKQHGEELLPIHEVRERRQIAMIHGIKAFADILPTEMQRAIEGLKMAGLDEEVFDPLLNLLKKRIHMQKTPSDEFSGLVWGAEWTGLQGSEALMTAMHAMRE